MKNNEKVWLTAIVMVLLLESCSPKVLTSISQSYPAVPVDSVRVFEERDTVPNSSQAVGQVSVLDRGTTTKCKYDYVLALAKEETARNGGNGLLITSHLEPDFMSMCHRIKGIMIRYTDTTIDVSAPNPVMEAVTEMATQSTETEERHRVPANLLRLSVGPSMIVSKMSTPTRTYDALTTAELVMEYEHVWKRGLGFGVNLSFMSFGMGDGIHVTQFSLCPTFVGAYKTDKGWLWNTELGIGYGQMDDGYLLQGGVVSLCKAGVDYMLSNHWGIGTEINSIVLRRNAPDGWDTKKDGQYGLQRYNLLVGLRYYF